MSGPPMGGVGAPPVQQKQPLGGAPAPTSGRGAQFFSVGGQGAAQPTAMQVRGRWRLHWTGIHMHTSSETIAKMWGMT